ncbi:MAG TPA: murein biosynthesis integral membrane protein MurJ, partial [Propionibacteriaceae bacterium]|nr:murein biosynthesis integral membrane protein MurJ [Propionibacteriaceae bacterium]HBY22453.1 murein biosynthesis integral membrane protein MurJ [Propionibacteriaceae bacterium]
MNGPVRRAASDRTPYDGRVSSQSAPGSKKLLKASAVMALGTLGSRLLGFVRLALLAVIWGNGTRSIELFTLSQYIPSSLYIIFAGGALNTVLVPQIVRAMVHHEDDGKAFVDRIMTIFLVALGVLTLLMTA